MVFEEKSDFFVPFWSVRPRGKEEAVCEAKGRGKNRIFGGFFLTSLNRRQGVVCEVKRREKMEFCGGFADTSRDRPRWGVCVAKERKKMEFLRHFSWQTQVGCLCSKRNGKNGIFEALLVADASGVFV